MRGEGLEDWRGSVVKASLIDGHWTVFFRPTLGQEFPALYLREFATASYAAAVVHAQLVADRMQQAGICTECNHSHIGSCRYIDKIVDGWATYCECIRAPSIPGGRHSDPGNERQVDDG